MDPCCCKGVKVRLRVPTQFKCNLQCLLYNIYLEPGTVAHVYDLYIRDAETRRLLWVLNHPGLPREHETNQAHTARPCFKKDKYPINTWKEEARWSNQVWIQKPQPHHPTKRQKEHLRFLPPSLMMSLTTQDPCGGRRNTFQVVHHVHSGTSLTCLKRNNWKYYFFKAGAMAQCLSSNNDLNLNPGTPMVEGESRVLQGVFWPPTECYIANEHKIKITK